MSLTPSEILCFFLSPSFGPSSRILSNANSSPSPHHHFHLLLSHSLVQKIEPLTSSHINLPLCVLLLYAVPFVSVFFQRPFYSHGLSNLVYIRLLRSVLLARLLNYYHCQHQGLLYGISSTSCLHTKYDPSWSSVFCPT